MKASRFPDARKAFVVKQGEDGTPVAEVCRQAGNRPATCFDQRRKFTGLLPDGTRRRQALEADVG